MTRTDLLPIAAALGDGRIDDAERACGTALALRPHEPALLQIASLISLTAGRLDEALRRARSALALAPDHSPTLVVAGRAARRLGDGPGAVAAFRRAAIVSPERAEPAFLLCAALLEAGDPAALALLDGVTRRFPANALGWDEIGRTLAAAGKHEAALAAFSRAFEAAPSVTLALRRAAVLKDLGRLSETRDAIAAARALGPLPARAWFMLGLVLQDLGSLAASADAYRKALDLDEAIAEAAVNLGIVLQETGDLDGARTAYGHAIRARPDTFGRIAQAITAPPKGELWLDLDALRASLAG